MAKRLSKILDPLGRPFEVAVLDQVQTDEAKVSGLHRRFAEHPSSGLTPYKLADILKSAEQGDLVAQAELADDMEEKDAHIFSETQKRKLALQRIDWQIEPPRNATKQEKYAAEFAWERLDGLDLADVIFDMADAILKSYSCQTINWELIEGYQTPVNINHIPPSWFTTPEQKRNQLQLLNDNGGSDPLWAGGWIVHQHKTKSGYIGRNGLQRTLAWPFLFKNYSLRDLAEFLEIYGLPLRLGKYPSGATDAEKAKLLQAVIEIGHNAAGIIPESMTIDFQNAAQGQADPFLAMMNWAEKSISKAVLGGTLTSSAEGGGAYALGNVHNEVRQDIRDADLRQIANTLTRDLIWPMIQFNLNGVDGFHRCPKFKFDIAEAEDLEKIAKAVPALQSAGMQISKNWLHDKTQIPEPESDDDILQPAQTEPAAEPQPAALSALTASPHQQGCQCSGCRSLAALNEQPRTTIADQISDQLQSAADAPQTELIEQLRNLVETAESFEAIQQGLLAMAGSDTNQLADLLAQAMLLAELNGRYDVVNEALNGG